MSVRAATQAAIEGAHGASAVYRGHLASHLPMALVALEAMGAGDARIAQYAARHASHLEPLGEEERAACAAWLREIESTGAEATLRRALARLGAAPGSGAFHGLIRTAYAMESGSAASAMPGFEAQVAAVAAAALSLDALAAAALRAYAATGDFTLLHAVTGLQAARTVARCAADGEALVAHAWRALVAAFLACGAPRFEAPAFAAECDAAWPELLARACDAEDEHDIKLAHAAWSEWRRTGDDLYRRAAAARLALAPATATD